MGINWVVTIPFLLKMALIILGIYTTLIKALKVYISNNS